jgi:glycosidase
MNYPLGFVLSDMFLHDENSPPEFTARLYTHLARLDSMRSSVSFNLLDSHDTQRVLWASRGNKLKVLNAFTFLFMLPGCPCIYYGTEIGLNGGRDPDNRRPMIWDQASQNLLMFDFFKKLIAFRKAHIDDIQRGKIEYIEENDTPTWIIGDTIKLRYVNDTLQVASR